MSLTTIILIILAYFGVLVIMGFITSRNANNQSFFIGNRKSPWYLVAFGMIGASLSGVTFLSVPGWVLTNKLFYMQMVMGYLMGYLVIVFVLLPIYYRMQLTSIYTYLNQRFGKVSYKTGASLFLISRLIGSAFRLFLVANVLQLVIFDKINVPFSLTVALTLIFIWIYTYRGGIKTIVWTDTFQTFFMLSAVALTVWYIIKSMDIGFLDAVKLVAKSEYGQIFDFSSWRSESFFVKYFLSGAFITIVMTGLDQDMMQKNLSCRSLKDAQKNMLSYALAFIPVNLLFLFLGALLYIFAGNHGIVLPERTDDVFQHIAMNGYLPVIVSVLFILGLIAAAYSTADSALAALTTSFLIDIMNAGRMPEAQLKRTRILVHLLMSLMIALIIIVFKAFNNASVISSLFKFAGYTYGPLLALFAFGMFTRRQVREKYIPYLSVAAPVAIFVLNKYSEQLFWGYKMGFEVLIYNGLLVFLVMYLLSFKDKKVINPSDTRS